MRKKLLENFWLKEGVNNRRTEEIISSGLLLKLFIMLM